MSVPLGSLPGRAGNPFPLQENASVPGTQTYQLGQNTTTPFTFLRYLLTNIEPLKKRDWKNQTKPRVDWFSCSISQAVSFNLHGPI